MKDLKKDLAKVIEVVLDFESNHKKDLRTYEKFNLIDLEYHMFMMKRLIDSREEQNVSRETRKEGEE